MLVLLVLSCFPLLWLLLLPQARCRGLAFLLAAVAWATYTVAVTEILSLARMITPAALACAWGGMLVLTAALAWRQRRTPDFERASATGWTKAIVVGLGIILLALLVIALVAPPNTWDGMTYHMSRVAHWAQNGTVAPYATNNGRQIHLGPGAEILILNLQVLSGGDRFANAVQWFALVGSMVGVSRIARSLGAGRDGQLFAAALCGSLPMAVLQATSTQNDLVVTFWIVSAVAFGFELRRPDVSPHLRWTLIVALGASAGLALLTKATSYVILPPLALLLLFAKGPVPFRARITSAAIAAVIALAVNAAFFARNAAASGSVLGPGREDVDGVMHEYKNEMIGVRTMISNVLRNAALQLVVPWTVWNDRVDEVVRTVHVLIDLMPSDPRTTLANQRFHLAIAFDHEDQAPAPLLAALVGASVVFMLVKKDRADRMPLAYLASIAVAFVLFCATLKWQPWHARLHLPMVVLACAAVGHAIERFVPRGAQAPLVLLALLAAVPNVVMNPSRPVLGKDSIFTQPRERQYFANKADRLIPYRDAVEQIASVGCDRVGLILPYDGFEYPLWALLHRANPAARIEHLNVTNYTRAFADRSFDPCLILRIGKDGKPVIEQPASVTPPRATRPESG